MSGQKITWDKYALQIDGKKIFLLGGEFHYWRVPDRERWRDILKAYKVAGLNVVRIYFHWGFHNLAEGKYVWNGNRDVDYLLTVCEELGLKVLVAAGPYICAETSGGGYPLWMVAKREIRIKHLKGTVRQQYDPVYMHHCYDWWKNFVSQMKHHQITENAAGCVIGFQIENEYIGKIAFIKGIRRYIEELVRYARELGITVPTFHNDASPQGSWNGVVDLYGFDKYVIFAPKRPKRLPIPPWNIKTFMKKVDGTEKTVRAFGPPASETPLMIPELQGGWYNHWTIGYGYDELYNYYGAPYQKTLVESFAAQGVTIMSLYMFYGGTNYGTIMNPEVYTSYDYSASIREYGFYSERFRLLRLFFLFVRSFESSFVSTDLVIPTKGDTAQNLTCSVPQMFYRQRRSPNHTDFYFFRNFTRNATPSFSINFPTQSGICRIPREGNITLKPRESFIAVGNCVLGGFTIEFCALPLLVQGPYANGILLILEHNGGELLLQGDDFTAAGDVTMLAQDGEEHFRRFNFSKPGMSTIQTPDGNMLYIVCLDRKDSLTLNADFSGLQLQAAWGAYSIFFNSQGQLELETFSSQEVSLLSIKGQIQGFEDVQEAFIPGFKRGVFGKNLPAPDLELTDWERREVHLDSGEIASHWKSIDFETERNPLDHRFLSGYVIYRCEFESPTQASLQMKINFRHRVALWLNHHIIGCSYVYDVGAGRPGAINGPDPKFGTKKFDLTPALLRGQKNVLFILTESFGLNKQFWLINDIRNPRGILSVKFSAPLISPKWSLLGTDVTRVEDPFNISSLPGEHIGLHLGKGEGWKKASQPLRIPPDDNIVWLKTRLLWAGPDSTRIPIRLHLSGITSVNIYFNGVYIGRYWRDGGPQHDFYIMEGLLKKGSNDLVLGCWGPLDGPLSVSVLPYKIKPDSGNINDVDGVIFTTLKHTINL